MKESVDEIKLINKSNKKFKVDDDKYYWMTKALQFYYKNFVKIKAWQLCFPDLSLIQNQ